MTEYDPGEQEFGDAVSKSWVNFCLAALRKFVSTLIRSGAVSKDSMAHLCDLLTPENAAAAVRFWSSHADEKGHISARTAYDYLKATYVVMSRNGVDPSPIRDHLKANRFLRGGQKASSEMSASSRSFCEQLLGSAQLTMSFLSMHVKLRNRANEMLKAIEGYVSIDGLAHPLECHRRPYFNEPWMAGRFMPNPYHPPCDSVRVKSGWGHRTLRVRDIPTPSHLMHYPQYAHGRMRLLET
jgi:hypothetical protein